MLNDFLIVYQPCIPRMTHTWSCHIIIFKFAHCCLNIVPMIFVLWSWGILVRNFSVLVMSFSGFNIRVMKPSRNELANSPPLLFSEIFDVCLISFLYFFLNLVEFTSAVIWEGFLFQVHFLQQIYSQPFRYCVSYWFCFSMFSLRRNLPFPKGSIDSFLITVTLKPPVMCPVQFLILVICITSLLSLDQEI